MTATLIQSPDRVILRHIRWQTYQLLIENFEAEPALRLTYDRGTLEIRMPLDPHETYKKLIGRFIEVATEELDLEIRSLGSRTCDRACDFKELARVIKGFHSRLFLMLGF